MRSALTQGVRVNTVYEITHAQTCMTGDDEADDEDVQFNLHRVQQAFGHAVFQLVVTRDNDWQKLAAKYAIPLYCRYLKQHRTDVTELRLIDGQT